MATSWDRDSQLASITLKRVRRWDGRLIEDAITVKDDPAPWQIMWESVVATDNHDNPFRRNKGTLSYRRGDRLNVVGETELDMLTCERDFHIGTVPRVTVRVKDRVPLQIWRATEATGAAGFATWKPGECPLDISSTIQIKLDDIIVLLRPHSEYRDWN